MDLDQKIESYISWYGWVSDNHFVYLCISQQLQNLRIKWYLHRIHSINVNFSVFNTNNKMNMSIWKDAIALMLNL